MNNKFDELAKGLIRSTTRWQPRRLSRLQLKRFGVGLSGIALLWQVTQPSAALADSPPVITNVVAAQQPSSKLVNIQYTISDPDSTNVNIYIKVSKDSGATWTVPAVTFSGDYGANIPVSAVKTLKQVVWNAGADWDGHYTTNCRVRIIANDAGMVLVAGGSYNRGNYVASNPKADNDITDAPPSTVSVSAFLIDPTPVSGGEWNRVVEGFAQFQGYAFEGAASFQGTGYPVQFVNWFDAVKWCNARSEMEGAVPVYYTDGGFATVYRSGETAPYVKPGANGYRLPTEAEWEKAARGGLSYLRFPWGDTISRSQANYFSCPDTNKCVAFPYDLGPAGFVGGPTPEASFPANGYGLFDMAGNVSEWCWDWYDPNYYNSQPPSDPQGPSSGTYRVVRGGSWSDGPNNCRCAFRGNYINQNAPSQSSSLVGFRCVRAF